jgi:hypothetical protein
VADLDWVDRTAALYSAVREHSKSEPERTHGRLSKLLDVVMTERVREVGLDQSLEDLRQVIHKVGA